MIAQIIGVVAYIFLLLSFFRKDRKEILYFQAFACLFLMVHYLYLGAASGAIVSLLSVIRSIIFALKDKHKWLNNNYVLCIFVFLFVISSIYSYNSIYSLLPGLAVIMYTIIIWNGTPDAISDGAIASSSFWVIYNVFVGSYPGIISESSIVLANIYRQIKKSE